jgi:iron complex outermembrane receptor protein
MDPPLSYVDSDQLESLALYRGIAPVSVAQESIGGAVVAKPLRGDFGSSPEFSLSGRLAASAQSVNDGSRLGVTLSGSNSQHRLQLAAMAESAGDADFPGGQITPSEYERQRFQLGYGYRFGRHSLQLDYSYTDTGEAGTAALPMDIDYIRGDLYSLGYRFEVDAGLTVTARLFGNGLDHRMTNYHLRQPPPDILRRRNVASAENRGFKLESAWQDPQGRWVFGLDGFQATHDSDIDNPEAPPFFVVNFNSAQQRLLGLFLERQHQFDAHWRGEFGFRYNHVRTEADEVDASAAMTMSPVQSLRDAFNSADRVQTDRNIDLVAKGWYQVTSHTSLYAGVAQKHRSPSYQERYLWLPLQATAGLADGKTYTGDIELRPEVSRQFEFGFDYVGPSLSVAPRLFYGAVEDYIQGTPGQSQPALVLVQMMNLRNGSNNPPPLQFTNVDARLYGFDMDWAWQLAEHWSLSGIVNYVRGKRDDISDDLYRIAPANASVRLNYSGGQWDFGLESVLYARQEQVSDTNGETATAGYGIVNINAGWQPLPGLRLTMGIDNLLDRNYREHLGGYNRAANPDVATGERLPAYGLNLHGRVLYEF